MTYTIEFEGKSKIPIYGRYTIITGKTKKKKKKKTPKPKPSNIPIPDPVPTSYRIKPTPNPTAPRPTAIIPTPDTIIPTPIPTPIPTSSPIIPTIKPTTPIPIPIIPTPDYITPVPTIVPSPTQPPSPSPTKPPMPSPTNPPTPSPTKPPTPSPTKPPTPSPTQPPLPSPTKPPTPSPTQPPLLSPTQPPSPSPTQSPTKNSNTIIPTPVNPNPPSDLVSKLNNLYNSSGILISMFDLEQVDKDNILYPPYAIREFQQDYKTGQKGRVISFTYLSKAIVNNNNLVNLLWTGDGQMVNPYWFIIFDTTRKTNNILCSFIRDGWTTFRDILSNDGNSLPSCGKIITELTDKQSDIWCADPDDPSNCDINTIVDEDVRCKQTIENQNCCSARGGPGPRCFNNNNAKFIGLGNPNYETFKTDLSNYNKLFVPNGDQDFCNYSKVNDNNFDGCWNEVVVKSWLYNQDSPSINDDPDTIKNNDTPGWNDADTKEQSTNQPLLTFGVIKKNNQDISEYVNMLKKKLDNTNFKNKIVVFNLRDRQFENVLIT